MLAGLLPSGSGQADRERDRREKMMSRHVRVTQPPDVFLIQATQVGQQWNAKCLPVSLALSALPPAFQLNHFGNTEQDAMDAAEQHIRSLYMGGQFTITDIP